MNVTTNGRKLAANKKNHSESYSYTARFSFRSMDLGLHEICAGCFRRLKIGD
jgi:hypothetical protein